MIVLATDDPRIAGITAALSAAFGAGVAGMITLRLHKRSWLRASRAAIYRGVLHDVHDAVNDVIGSMEKIAGASGSTRGDRPVVLGSPP